MCRAHCQGLSHQCLLHLACPRERWRPEEMLAGCPDSSAGRPGHVPPYTGQGQELLVQLWRNVGPEHSPRRHAEGFRSFLDLSVLNPSSCETGSAVIQVLDEFALLILLPHYT